MLKIIANNQELDLGSLKGISQKKNPGIFDLDSTDGSYNVPFNIDANHINNKAFDFPYKIGNPDNNIREVPGELWHSGIRISEGVIKANKFTHKKIACNFYIDNGTLYKDFNEKLLNENDFGGYKAWVSKNTYDCTIDDFALYPVKNDNYFDGTSSEGTNFTLGKYHNYHQGGFIWSHNDPSIITPFPLLWRTLNYLFTNKGFQYYDNFFSQGDYRRINIFNTVNAIEAEIYTHNTQERTRNTLSRYNLANHMPRIPTGEFIKAIQNFFNIKFYVRDYKVQLLDRLQLIENSSYDDLSSKVVGHYTKELTGEDTSGVALNLQADTNDNNTAGLSDIPDDFIYDTTIDVQGTTHDIYPTFPYKTVLSHNNNNLGRYYRYANAQDFGHVDHYWYWFALDGVNSSPLVQKMFDEQRGCYLGDKQFEINANLNSVPLHLSETDNPSYDNYMPKVRQKGNSYQHSKFNEFSLRLMLYTGTRDIETFGTIPSASNTFGNISITSYWSYFNRWRKYIDWYKKAVKEKYQVELNLTASEIKNFDFSRKKLINGHLFYITNMAVQLTRRSINPVKCTMIKAKP